MSIQNNVSVSNIDFDQLFDMTGKQADSSAGVNASADTGAASAAGKGGDVLKETALGSGTESSTKTNTPTGNWTFNRESMSLDANGARYNSATLNSRGEAKLDRWSFGPDGAQSRGGRESLGNVRGADAASGVGANGANFGSDFMKEFGQKMRDAVMGSFNKMFDEMFGKDDGSALPSPAAQLGSKSENAGTQGIAGEGSPVENDNDRDCDTPKRTSANDDRETSATAGAGGASTSESEGAEESDEADGSNEMQSVGEGSEVSGGSGSQDVEEGHTHDDGENDASAAPSAGGSSSADAQNVEKGDQSDGGEEARSASGGGGSSAGALGEEADAEEAAATGKKGRGNRAEGYHRGHREGHGKVGGENAGERCGHGEKAAMGDAIATRESDPQAEGADAPEEATSKRVYDADLTSDTFTMDDLPEEMYASLRDRVAQGATGDATGDVQTYDFASMFDLASAKSSSNTDLLAALDTNRVSESPSQRRDIADTLRNDNIFGHEEAKRTADGVQVTRWRVDFSPRDNAIASNASDVSGKSKDPNSDNDVTLRRDVFTLKPRAATTEAPTFAVDRVVVSKLDAADTANESSDNVADKFAAMFGKKSV